MKKQQFKKYSFSTEEGLTEEALCSLVDMLESPPTQYQSVLGGRGGIRQAVIEGFGSVVIKQYKRGGLLGRLIKNRYIRWGACRPEKEFALLNDVRALGVLAPQPIAAITTGGLFYSGWLAMKELPTRISLADYSIEKEEEIEPPMQALTTQIETLIHNNIFHVDLHPGNALLDDEGKVYVLDFDKAERFFGRKNDLRDKYVCRWRRAVIKHRLPETLSELMCIGLRKNFDFV